MADFLKSISDALNASNDYPMKRVSIMDSVDGTTTNATTTSGYTHIRVGKKYYTVPTLPSGVTPYLIKHEMITGSICEGVVAIRVKLGTLTGSGGTWTSSNLSSMPTRQIYGAGSSAQLAAMRVVLTPSVTLVGSPAVTVTYTAQDGSTGNTASLTMPSGSVVNSGFDLHPYFASGKTGVKEVTAISGSGGTSGTIEVYGLIPLSAQVVTGTGLNSYQNSMINMPYPKIPLVAGDELGFFYSQTLTPSGVFAAFHNLYFGGSA